MSKLSDEELDEWIRKLIFEALTGYLEEQELVYSIEEEQVSFIYIDIDRFRHYDCWVYVDENNELDFSSIWVRRIPEKKLQAVAECIKEIESRLGTMFLRIHSDPYTRILFCNPRSNIMFWNMLKRRNSDLCPGFFKTFIEANIEIMDDLVTIIENVLKAGFETSKAIDLASEKLEHIRDRMEKERDNHINELREFLRRELDQ